jgi:hypothetical protein
MASPDFESWESENVVGVLERFFQDEVSLRRLSRETSIPYSTLQGIRSGTTRNPSPLTISRIEMFYDRAPVLRTPRQKTVVDDSLAWTETKLANLSPPRSANAFQIIGHKSPTSGDTPHSGYIDLESMSPLDYVLERGIDPRTVRRIVWARRGGFVRGF